MKQTKHILLMAAMLLCCATVSAQTKVEIGGIWYNLIAKGSIAEVSSGNYSGEIIIPPTVTYEGEEYNVTSIGQSAFYRSSISTIYISEGITSIGQSAFYRSSISTIYIPENSKLESIGTKAFLGTNLNSISIPEGVTIIGESAFSECSYLTSIHIPDDSKLKNIGSGAFSDCSRLTSINIPKEITNIGSGAFEDCKNLTTITIPENSQLKSIGHSTFLGCTNLTSITIPEGVTEIPMYAFCRCSSLTSVNIPQKVTFIGSYAFSRCNSLTTITIPASARNISTLAFANCTELLDVYCYAEKAPSTSIDAFEGSYPEYATLYVPEYALDSYQTTAPWSSFGNIQTFITGTCGDNLTWTLTNKGELIIEGTGAMYDFQVEEKPVWLEYRNSIQSVDIREGVTSIGDGAFEGLVNLTAITIPESVTLIGDLAFEGCYSLTSITIPKSVSSIGMWAFVYCWGLESIIVADDNTTFDSRENCNAIIETSSDKLILGCAATVIPENVTTIGNAAFCGCTNLTNITIPENVTSIEEGAFVDCTSLNTVTLLSKNLSSIGSEAFAYCDKLSDIYCHSTSVPSTENDAFNDSYPENIILHVPANAIDDYKGIEPWSSFGTIVAIVEPTLGKCSTPTISYVDGQIMLACETEEVEFITNVVTENELTYEEATFDFVPTYTFNAYATKDKYEDSDVATITLCWIPCTENHDTNNVITIPAKPVLIQSHEGIVTISGLAEGVEIAVYNTAGYKVASSIADNGTAIIDTNLTAGSVAIVEIGGKGIKIVVK